MEEIILALELYEMVVQGTQQLQFLGQWDGICVSAHGMGAAAGAGSPGQGECQGDGHKPV